MALFASDSDSSSDNSISCGASLSITKRLLDKPVSEVNYCDSSTITPRNLIQTVSTYIPLIATNMLSQKRLHGGSTPGRRVIQRDRETRHDQILKDYFLGEDSKYIPETFRRHFRMNEDLFTRILKAIEGYVYYFTQKIDATGRLGLSPLQKMIALSRMLAYGVPADYVDEYVQIGQSTAFESLIHFCDAVIGIFEERYLRKPNSDDIVRLLKENEPRGFPGMLGSLDCMHWNWSSCPKAWHDMYTNGFKRVSTLILEAVASRDLWLWHALFGMAGTKNDINILDRSPLFDDIINGVVPTCHFELHNLTEYTHHMTNIFHVKTSPTHVSSLPHQKPLHLSSISDPISSSINM